MTKQLDFNDITDEQIKSDTKGRPNGGNLLSLEEGDTTIRIMPPWAKGKQYHKAYKMHFGLLDLVNYGLEVDSWYSSPCLGDSGGRCPLCALSNKAKALGTRGNDTTLLNLNKAMRAKQQYAANVVNLANPEQVLILPFGKKIFEDLQAIFGRKGNITHPITGRNVVITKRKIPGQQWFDYSVSVDDVEDISGNWDNLKIQLHDLDSYPNLPDYDDVTNKLQGIELVAPNSGSSSVSTIPGYTPGVKGKADELDDLLDNM